MEYRFFIFVPNRNQLPLTSIMEKTGAVALTWLLVLVLVQYTHQEKV